MNSFSEKYTISSSANMAFSLKHVLISDEIDAKCIDILKANGIEVDKNTKLSKEQLIAEIPVSTPSRCGKILHIWGLAQPV